MILRGIKNAGPRKRGPREKRKGSYHTKMTPFPFLSNPMGFPPFSPVAYDCPATWQPFHFNPGGAFFSNPKAPKNPSKSTLGLSTSPIWRNSSPNIGHRFKGLAIKMSIFDMVGVNQESPFFFWQIDWFGFVCETKRPVFLWWFFFSPGRHEPRKPSKISWRIPVVLQWWSSVQNSPCIWSCKKKQP